MSSTKYFLSLLLICATGYRAEAQERAFVLAENGKAVEIVIDTKEKQVVHTAAGLLAGDIKAVSGAPSLVRESRTGGVAGNIIAGTIGTNKTLARMEKDGLVDLSTIRGQWEGFIIRTVDCDGRRTLVIAGSDSNGTAYGMLEVSRLIGVSPWHFFADAPLPRKETLALPGTDIRMMPSVQYRGIFINDEDWGMLPWASTTLDPGAGEGVIGPAAHGHIFELLLRLRANTFWPAMHGCSVPFYLIPGNPEEAGKYGIYIGTSHCEPMACNVNGEWKIRGEGVYDYTVNRGNVRRFWEERVRQTAGYNTIYTLGMRGVHDGAMQGAETVEEQKKVLEDALADQREMLVKRVGRYPAAIPQVFIPYKEVEDIYNAGLEVPDDVTLMWCDDNYGFIRHFPTPGERARKGGNGIYYHISYWGRPHDYLWLATTHPALVYHQMRTAYDCHARKMWILNVGDIKPAEYLTELFLDMAWDMEQVTTTGVNTHLANWLGKTLNIPQAGQTARIMNEYYRLAYIRKPEFMGNSRVEESDPAHSAVKDLPWSEKEIRKRLAQYEAIAGEVRELSAGIPQAGRDAWFQLVEYPVLAANEMNKKMLYAQLARHGKASREQSDAALDSIASLTRAYNTMNNGKWSGIMDFQPRKLAVFRQVPEHTGIPLAPDRKPLAVFNGSDYTASDGNIGPTQGLGYEGKAVSIPKGSSATYRVEAKGRENLSVEVRLLPNHPVAGDRLRFLISAGGSQAIPVGYETKGRSEEWKRNVLGNQAVRCLILPVETSAGGHEIIITALDEGVVLDQLVVE